MGYHPGIEDDGVYLAAVKSDLNPALYPHDADFFKVQLQATFFDKWIADFIHLTHIPVAFTELLFQSASIVLIIFGCWSIARRLFAEERAQWAGVAMVVAMFTLPVAGTALYLVDQHLHPRNLATALILIAISRLLAGKRWHALPLLLLSIVLHPIMGAMGMSFCFFLTLALMDPVPVRLRAVGSTAAGFMPLGWIFDPPTALWREALETRTYYYLYRWTWYEWLGVLAPLVLFFVLWRVAEKRGQTRLARFALAVFAYAVFQQTVAMIMLGPEAFIRLLPFQPMRYLHLVYFFLCLISGSLLGKYLLKTKVWRWAIFLLIANGGMFYAQRELFASSQHLELPSREPSNRWLQAFAWIRHNTPENAYFALDPRYMAAPDEDYHSFRALAERSVMADAIKDTAVVTQVPSLAPVWKEQEVATADWEHFQIADFERLKATYGVNWVLVTYPPPNGLACRWHNGSISVCQIP